MRLKLPKKILAALAILTVALPGFGVAAALAQGLTDTSPKPALTEVVIPGSPVEQSVNGFMRGRVTDLAQYISLIYNFLLGVIGVLAAVSMIWGGFMYLTAGGNKSKVDAGRKRILDSIAGLAIAFTAYLLLNTINPDLVNFKTPKVDTVGKEVAVFSALPKGGLAAPCKKDNDCASPYKCLKVETSTCAQAIEYFTIGLTTVATLPVGGATALKGGYTALKYVGTKMVAVLGKAGAVGAAGVGSYVAWNEISDMGYTGVCATEAVHAVSKGDSCTKDEHCKAGLSCLKDPRGGSCFCPECGFCSDGSSGSACFNGDFSTCKSGLKCVEAASGIYFCADGKTGAPCDEDYDCDRGGVCRATGSIGGSKHCGPPGAGVLWASCSEDVDCKHGGDRSAETDYSIDDPRYSCLRPLNNESCDPSKVDFRCVCHVRNPANGNTAGFPCYRNSDCAFGHYCKSKKSGVVNRDDSVNPTIGACQKQ